MSGAAWVPRALIGRRFGELADPFASLLALWRTGYWLDSSVDNTTHTVRLLAPPADDRRDRSSERLSATRGGSSRISRLIAHFAAHVAHDAAHVAHEDRKSVV